MARYLYKLMAYKDEYEVARLLTKSSFEQQLGDMWEQVESIGYNLHPPLLRALGWKKKIQFGQWFGGPLRVLAKLKMLRGTALDVFGYAAVRREERELIVWYRELIEECLRSLPDQIRGYEKIKSESVAQVKALAAEKLAHMSRIPVLR